MKKGSQARKCYSCKRIVFWFVPKGDVLGIPFCETKKILPYRIRKEDKFNRYFCLDCLRRMYPGEY